MTECSDSCEDNAIFSSTAQLPSVGKPLLGTHCNDTTFACRRDLCENAYTDASGENAYTDVAWSATTCVQLTFDAYTDVAWSASSGAFITKEESSSRTHHQAVVANESHSFRHRDRTRKVFCPVVRALQRSSSPVRKNWQPFRPRWSGLRTAAAARSPGLVDGSCDH